MPDHDRPFNPPVFLGGSTQPRQQQFVFVSNALKLDPNGPPVKLDPNTPVKLDPNSSVAVRGPISLDPNGPPVKLDPSTSVTLHGNPKVALARGNESASVDFNGIAQPVTFSNPARSYLSLVWERLPGAITESVLVNWTSGTFQGNKINPVASSYKVTNGKTLRITQLGIAVIATAATVFNSRFRLRMNGPQPVTNSSPIFWQGELGINTPTAAVGQENSDSIFLFDGFEIPGGTSITFTHIESVATGLVSLSLVGYEQ